MTQTSGNRYGDITASGQARLHLGDVRNNYSYHYSIHKRKSDETLREDERNRVLLTAAAEGQTARLRHLLRMGVDLDHSDELGLTALHHASLSGFDDTVEILLDAGANVNDNSHDCGTPLHLATLMARKTVVGLLLKYRARVDIGSRLLGTSMHCAHHNGDTTILDMLKSANAREDLRAVVLPSLMESITLEGDLIPQALVCRLWQRDEEDSKSSKLGYLTLWCLPSHLAVVKDHLLVLDSPRLIQSHCHGTLISEISEQFSQRLCASNNTLDVTCLAILFNQHLLLSELRKSRAIEISSESERHARHMAIRIGHSLCLEAFLIHRGTKKLNCLEEKEEIDLAISSAERTGDKACLQMLLRWYAQLDGDALKTLTLRIMSLGYMDVLDCVLDRWRLPTALSAHYELTLGAAGLASEECLSKLITSGLDIDEPSSQSAKRRTPLMDAVVSGNEGLVLRLLNSGASMDLQDRNGDTALLLAVHKALQGPARFCLGHDAAQHLVGEEADDISSSVSYEGFLSLVSFLVENGASVDRQNIHGDTALIQAVRQNNVPIMTLLLSRGPLLDLRDEDGDPALVSAARRGHSEAASLLLDHGVSLDQRNVHGQTALLTAVRENNMQVMAIILRRDPSLDLQDEYGNTALLLAAHKGLKDLVIDLVRRGASVDLQNRAGGTPLLAAIRRDYDYRSGKRPVPSGSCQWMVAFLLDHGASATLRDNYFMDPLEACLYLEEDPRERGLCLELVLDALESIDQSLRTPLHCYFNELRQSNMGSSEAHGLKVASSHLSQRIKHQLARIEICDGLTNYGPSTLLPKPSVRSEFLRSWSLVDKFKKRISIRNSI